MALPSFLQAMFTPQRPGPGQMAWRDIVNEDSGEFSTGDMQEMYWEPSTIGSNYVSGPTTRRLPPPNATTGMGQDASQDIQDAIRSIAPGTDGGGMDSGLSSMSGLEPGGMSSITEVMQSFGGPTQDELGYGGGGAGYGGLGAGLTDRTTMTAFDDTGGQDWEAAMADSVSAPMTTSAPGSFQHMDTGVQDTFAPGYNADIQDSPPSFARRRDPTAAVGDFLRSLFSGGGEATAPKVAPPLFVPPDTLGSTGGQFKNIYEGQTGGDDVMNAFKAYLRQRQ